MKKISNKLTEINTLKKIVIILLFPLKVIGLLLCSLLPLTVYGGNNEEH